MLNKEKKEWVGRDSLVVLVQWVEGLLVVWRAAVWRAAWYGARRRGMARGGMARGAVWRAARYGARRGRDHSAVGIVVCWKC